MELAVRIANVYQSRIKFHIEPSDLEGVAILGLFYAARRFDPKKAKFSTYAQIRIEGKVKDYLALDHVKYMGKTKALPLTLTGEHSEPHGAAGVLGKAMACLPARLRTLIVLRFFAGWTHAEVAKELGLTIFRTWQLQTEALGKLRWILEQRGVHSTQDVL